MHFDVVIAGAGPAGSKTAWELARAGVKVLVVEEHAQVGPPVHCSGLVTPRTLRCAGIGDWVVQHRITGALIYSDQKEPVRWGDERLRAVAIDRPALDAWLIAQAQENGAELWLSCRLESIDYGGQGLRLGMMTRNGKVTVTSRLLVGADGAGSRVSRFLGQHSNSERIVAIGATLALPEPRDQEHVRVFLGDHVAPGWFGWLIPAGDGCARVGIGAPMDVRASPRQLLDHLFQAFPGEFQGAKVMNLSGGTIPLYRPIRSYGDNIMLVGDAARQVKPLSGGGIRTALLGAIHCARTALDAIRIGDYSACFLGRYQKRWHQDMEPEFEIASRLRRMAYRLPSSQRHRLLELSAHPIINRVLHQWGDIDFPGRLYWMISKHRDFHGLLASAVPAALPNWSTTGDY